MTARPAKRAPKKKKTPGVLIEKGQRTVVPRGLKRGDAVAVVAPGYPARDDDALRRGLGILLDWGLVPRPGHAIAKVRGYFAGTDEERARDLQEAISDPEIRGILFVRGGWGTSRILPALDLEPLRAQKKLLVGYSDMTVLFAEAWRKFGLVCGYGPVVPDLPAPERFHLPSLRRALFRPEAPLTLRVPRESILARGDGPATGRLVGGCLTLLAHLCGSRRLPDTRGAVVFFEEIAEEPYRIDRMLWQLREAGFIGRHCAAVLVGQMTGCEPRPGVASLSLDEVLRDHLGSLGIPVLTGIPAGHGDGKWTLPLGFRAAVNGRTGAVTLRP